MKMYSQKEAANRALAGGGWTEIAALDVAGGIHDIAEIPFASNGDEPRQIIVRPDHECYFKFDQDSTDTISSANSMILAASVNHVLPVPYELGAYSATVKIIAHLKHTGTEDPSTVRVIVN